MVARSSPRLRPLVTERVKRLVIANTWCWPVGHDFHFRSFSFLMSRWIGQYMLRHHSIFVNRVMPRAVCDRSVLTPVVMAHYRGAQPSPAARTASATPAGLHRGRERLAALDLAGPRRLRGQAGAHLLWGLKDIAFRRKKLERRQWRAA